MLEQPNITISRPLFTEDTTGAAVHGYHHQICSSYNHESTSQCRCIRSGSQYHPVFPDPVSRGNRPILTSPQVLPPPVSKCAAQRHGMGITFYHVLYICSYITCKFRSYNTFTQPTCVIINGYFSNHICKYSISK